MQHLKVIIILLYGFGMFTLGAYRENKKYEQNINKFWGDYYNIESQGDYWKLRSKKEGLSQEVRL